MYRSNPTSRRSSLQALALGATGLALCLGFASASSHREAPLITEMPKVDGTDFYMFTSYETGRQDFVTVVANYQPLQDAYGGPNYFTLDPDAHYEIKFDNDGDAIEDVTLRVRSATSLKDIQLPIGNPGQEKMVSVALRNVGPIVNNDQSQVNETEWFQLDLILGTGPNKVTHRLRNAADNDRTFSKPIDNIGTKSIPDYATYASSRIYDVKLPDGSFMRAFVGQRKDPFVVNLGETFDLVNNNPVGPVNGRGDDLDDANITSLIFEIPKSFLTVPGQPIVGGWTTASLPKRRTLLRQASYDTPTENKGPMVQVSRLGSPLVNEVVIGLPDKNRFNSSSPQDDAQFTDYVTHPTLPALIEGLFGVRAPSLFPRTDLVQVFATGVPGLTENGSFGEMLRLNTDVPPTPKNQQSELGVLGGDLAGFPNGRRPGDDVVDQSLRVLMGVLLNSTLAPDGQLPYTDGAFVDADFFDATFPYLKDPIPGSPLQ